MNPLLHYDPDDPYPESDGQPMADNTEQYEWIVKIKENLEILFVDRPDVFYRRRPLMVSGAESTDHRAGRTRCICRVWPSQGSAWFLQTMGRRRSSPACGVRDPVTVE